MSAEVRDQKWAKPQITAVKELLIDMRAGRLALPDFQRSFVWDPADTREMLLSIFLRYPTGTLLFLDQAEEQFRARPFEGLEKLRLPKSPSLVLDGQQRLTALFQALTGTGTSQFFVDLNVVSPAAQKGLGLDPTALEGAIVYRDGRAKKKSLRPPASTADQATQFLFPLSVLGEDEVDAWIDEIDEFRNPDGDKEQRKLLQKIARDYLRPVREYHFPSITLPSSTPLDAVCRIFETLNKSGVKLTVFELLTARFWPAGVDLRARWKTAKEQHPILDKYDVDAYSLLQAVSLRSTRARVKENDPPKASAQRSDVLNLTAAEFDAYWDSVAAGAANVLSLLGQECGVLTPKWLPYSMIIVPMAAAWELIDRRKGAAWGAARNKLIRYFWCSVFMRNYDQGGNSQAGRDYLDLESWFDGKGEPEAVRDFNFADETLDTAKVNLKALFRGFMALTLRNRARDFQKCELIDAEKIAAQEIDAHHIFPAGYLEDIGSKADSDLILNRTLIDKVTNQRIGKKAPSVYIAEMDSLLGSEQVVSLLSSHLLPHDSDSALVLDDYAEFLIQRKEILLASMKEVTGTKPL